MGTDEGYNGWTNRETWAVALWINNDQGMQESVHETVRTYLDGVDMGDGFHEPSGVGQQIRDYIEDLFDWEQYRTEDSPTRGYGRRYTLSDVSADLLAMRDEIGSLWRVNWDELGAAFLADVQS